jgi:sugar lactone lactonase YvrE/NAD(P)-dependent dehydrogenase (short-subunit alcohol dehydrogenase family)
MLDFIGRVTLVTGSGRGLGLAYARVLAERGATVIVQDSGTNSDGVGDDSTIAKQAAARIGGRAVAASHPIATQADCLALIEHIVAEHGRLDVLIHNAGWVGYQHIEKLEPDFLDRMMRLSVDTSLWLAQGAWPHMREAGFGRILLTTSDRAIYPEYAQKGLAAYAAAKMAVVGIANVLALEGEEHGITVNTISPVAKTRMWGIVDEPEDMRPEAVAAGAAYLVSPDCSATGWILRAANGQFVATKAREAENVVYSEDLAAFPAATPEAVAEGWPLIAVERPEPRNEAGKRVTATFHGDAVLGECPLWSERHACLFWVDTAGRTLNRFDPATGRNQAFGMPDEVGMIAERSDGTLVVAIGCDLASVGEDGAVERFATAPDGSGAFRLNDGRFDKKGRLWIGLMHKEILEGTGILYRHDPDGSWHVMDRGFTLINGVDWSPDGETLYATDSRARAVYAYDFDAGEGAIGSRRPFASFGPDDGFPDGLLVASDGAMWSTLFNGGAIQRVEADGSLSHRIELPVSRPTSCAFTPDGRALFVTTARLGLGEAELKLQPLAGAVLLAALPTARRIDHIGDEQ